ncbi:Hypothetical predicted protein [Pelobates cultripes]|uniref:Uncharacterized protein n=1 Tax=Pelobates cultripes TaxID=61616 RepID=A0AAD1RG89_PELCU|nr:Hypothetical predicted protein [Pelobates cultripes]
MSYRRVNEVRLNSLIPHMKQSKPVCQDPHLRPSMNSSLIAVSIGGSASKPGLTNSAGPSGRDYIATLPLKPCMKSRGTHQRLHVRSTLSTGSIQRYARFPAQTPGGLPASPRAPKPRHTLGKARPHGHPQSDVTQS